MKGTGRYDAHRRQVGVDRWRSLLVWVDDDDGREVYETVAWAGRTASDAIATVAAYCPARWMPTEVGYTLVRVEVRFGRFVETRNGCGVADVEWRDAGPVGVGRIDPDSCQIVWDRCGDREHPSG